MGTYQDDEHREKVKGAVQAARQENQRQQGHHVDNKGQRGQEGKVSAKGEQKRDGQIIDAKGGNKDGEPGEQVVVGGIEQHVQDDIEEQAPTNEADPPLCTLLRLLVIHLRLSKVRASCRRASSRLFHVLVARPGHHEPGRRGAYYRAGRWACASQSKARIQRRRVRVRQGTSYNKPWPARHSASTATAIGPGGGREGT